MKKILLSIMIFSISVSTQAQIWERVYPEYYETLWNSNPSVFKQIKDSHFIYATSANNKETYLIKINRFDGDVIFEKKITFSLTSYDQPNDVIETNTGNLIFIGISDNNSEGQKAWIIKTDSLGNIVNQRTFLPGGNYGTGGLLKIVKLDSTYLACGYTSIPDYYIPIQWLVEFNENLEIIEQDFLNIGTSFSNLKQDDSCFISFGYVWQANYFSIKIVKMNKNFEKIWEKIYSQNEIDMVRPENIQIGKDCYFLSGKKGTNLPAILMINKNDGNLTDIKYCMNFNCPVAGAKHCFENDGHYFIVVQTGQHLSGEEAKIVTVSLTEKNQSIKYKEYFGCIGTPGQVQILNDGKHYVIAGHEDYEGPKIIVDTLPTIDLSNNEPKISSDFALYQNYPNPFNGETKIRYNVLKSEKAEIRIYNLKGNKIRTFVCITTPNCNEITWNGTNEYGKQVSSGVYVYQLLTEKKSFSKKLIFEK